MFRLNQSKKRIRNGINRKLWPSIFRTIYEWKMYNNFKHERENNNKGEKNIASVLHHFDFFFFKFCCLFAATTRCSAITIGCICTICVCSLCTVILSCILRPMYCFVIDFYVLAFEYSGVKLVPCKEFQHAKK